MSNAFPRKIANLITEDPGIIRENHKIPHGWQHEKQLEAEELEDLEILGDTMYFVKFTIGLDFNAGESMVMYDRDGGGYPGSPDEIEWDILSIDEAEGVDQNGDEIEVDLSEELKEKIKNALYRHLDDEMIKNEFENDLGAEDDDGDDRYDRYDRYDEM